MKDHELAALIVLPIALTGTLCNWAVFILALRSKTFQHSFGRLTAAQSVGDALHSTLFLTCFVPMAYFNNQWMIAHSKYVGHCLQIAFNISTYVHLCISANRFCSLVFPFHYQQIFSQLITRYLIVLCYFLAIIPFISFYNYYDCVFYLNDKTWVFMYKLTSECEHIIFYVVYLKHTVTVLLIAVLDLLTVAKVHVVNRKNSTSSAPSRRIQEIEFLKQACCKALLFMFGLTIFFVFFPFLSDSNNWAQFITATVSWASLHSLDGMITLYFNREFRHVFEKMFY